MYIMEYYSAVKCHLQWHGCTRDCHIVCMWNAKKKKGTNESICKIQIESQNKPMITKGEMDRRDKLGDWDWHTYYP